MATNSATGKDEVSKDDYDAYSAALATHLGKQHKELNSAILRFMEQAKVLEGSVPFVSDWKPFRFDVGQGSVESIWLTISVQRSQDSYWIAYINSYSIGPADIHSDTNLPMATYVVPPAVTVDNVPDLNTPRSAPPQRLARPQAMAAGGALGAVATAGVVGAAAGDAGDVGALDAACDQDESANNEDDQILHNENREEEEQHWECIAICSVM